MPRRALFGEHNANGATGVTALGFLSGERRRQDSQNGDVPRPSEPRLSAPHWPILITLNTWVVCEVDTFYHLPHNLTFTGSHIL